MLKEFGCEFSIVGHSERRIIFGEDVNLVAQRAAAVLKQDFKVIFCIGETLDQRKQGITNKILEQQLMPLLEVIGEKEARHLIFAYEPVWAIGTGVVAKIEEIDETHKAVEKIWRDNSPLACPPILYGGSVAPNNFADIIKVPLVAGALIGGASLTFESMQALAKIAEAN
jgi:triosephosphate isomerase (TIM)